MPLFKDMHYDEAGDLCIQQVFRAPKTVDDERGSFRGEVEVPTGHSVRLRMQDDGTNRATLTNEGGKSIVLRIQPCSREFLFNHRKKSLTFQIFNDKDDLQVKRHLMEDLPRYLVDRDEIEHMPTEYFLGHVYQLAIDKKLLPDIPDPEYGENLLKMMRKSKAKYGEDFTEYWKSYVKREDKALQASVAR